MAFARHVTSRRTIRYILDDAVDVGPKDDDDVFDGDARGSCLIRSPSIGRRPRIRMIVCAVLCAILRL